MHHKNQRTIRILVPVLAVSAAIVLGGCGQNANTAATEANADSTGKGKQIIKVGFVYPKTGTYASFGEYSEEFTNYAIQKANKAGIVVDGKKASLSLVTADSGSSPTNAEDEARKLIRDKKIDVMITSKTADTTVPVSRVCEQNHILCLSVDTPDEAWAVENHKYSFHAGFTSGEELTAFMGAWKQASTNKRIGILHANDSEGSTMIDMAPGFASENGFTAYDPGSYTPGTRDFSSIIRNLKTQKVQILAGVMSDMDFSELYSQLREDGYAERIKVITVAKAALFQSDIEQIRADGICTEVWWTPEFPTSSSIDGMTSTELGKEFTRMTGSDEIPMAVGYDYANIEILYHVLKNAGTLDTERLVQAAEDLDIRTVIGEVKFNRKHYSSQPLVTGQWIYNNVNNTWKRNLVDTASVSGLQNQTVRLQPLGN